MAERRSASLHLRRLALLVAMGLALAIVPALGGAAKPPAEDPTGAKAKAAAAGASAAKQKKKVLPPAQRGADVKDTHDRLDRIYTKLGIERGRKEAAQAEQQGCSCDKSNKRRAGRQAPKPFRPPALPPFLGWLLIGLVVVAMLVPLILALRNSYRDVAQTPEEVTPGDEDDAEAGATPAGPWHVSLDECRRLAGEGRLAEAYASLHRLTLIALERAGHLSLEATITNWEYVRRLISRPPLRELLAEVTLAAERSVLGHSPPGSARFAELLRLVVQRLEGVS